MFDKFDLVNDFEKQGAVEPKYINMEQFAKDFYREANPDEQEVPSFHINELSISGNQPASKNEEYMSHNPWKGEDDSKPEIKKLFKIKKPADHDNLNIALEPQRIRLFEIEYDQLSTAQSQPVVQSTPSKKPNLKLKPVNTKTLVQTESHNLNKSLSDQEVEEMDEHY